eukprot:1647943-Pyramimonas_sp.AAC.1
MKYYSYPSSICVRVLVRIPGGRGWTAGEAGPGRRSAIGTERSSSSSDARSNARASSSSAT